MTMAARCRCMLLSMLGVALVLVAPVSACITPTLIMVDPHQG